MERVNVIYVDLHKGEISLLHIDDEGDEEVIVKFSIDPDHPMTWTDGDYGASESFAVEVVK